MATAPVSADFGESFEELVNVFTATADRLKGLTLGRGLSKFKPSPRKEGAYAGAQSSVPSGTMGGGKSKGSSKGPPSRGGNGRGKGRDKGRGGFNLAPGETFADLKKRTACSVCGRIGHWRSDPSCPKNPTKAVCICGSEFEEYGFLLVDDEDYHDAAEEGAEHDAYVASRLISEGPASSGSFVCFPATTEASDESDEVFAVRNVYLNQSELPVFMVVDTGCQRLVGGCQYLDDHEKHIKTSLGLQHIKEPEKQFYRFGKGDPECSTVSRWVPIGIGGIPMLLRCSSVKVNVPLLGSRLFMSQSGAVIDNFQSKIFFHRFNVTRDLLLSPNGHLCIRIDEYPETGFPRKADRWARDARQEFAG